MFLQDRAKDASNIKGPERVFSKESVQSDKGKKVDSYKCRPCNSSGNVLPACSHTPAFISVAASMDGI